MKTSFILAGGVALALIAAAAMAHKGATGVVKMRMDSMGVAKTHIERLAKIAGGQSVWSAAEVSTLASAIADEMAATPDHFATRDLSPPTEAVPAIWEEMGDFADLSQASAKAARAVATAPDLQAMRPALLALGKTCTTCHDKYRQIKP